MAMLNHQMVFQFNNLVHRNTVHISSSYFTINQPVFEGKKSHVWLLQSEDPNLCSEITTSFAKMTMFHDENLSVFW
jgi:hypothetical protein